MLIMARHLLLNFLLNRIKSNMHNILIIDKPIGFTPLETIQKIKKQYPHLANMKISYAGRLDPLAHGVLLLLVGEEVKKRTTYLSLAKTYEFEAVFGIQTDTYDLLGYVKDTKIKQESRNVKLFVNTFVNKHLGKQLQSYPPYSSKPVQGKPLFLWARNNKLSEIDIPKHEIEIFTFSCVNIGEITLRQLRDSIEKNISSVKGDFRQKEIIVRWKALFFENDKERKLQTAKFHITCSSGTYIRELVHKLGKELCSGAVAIDILRTAVGEYTLQTTIKQAGNNYGVFEIM